MRSTFSAAIRVETEVENGVPVAPPICSPYAGGEQRGAENPMDLADVRLDRMIEIADEMDVPLDHVVAHIGRCDQSFFESVSDNPDLLPRYTQSSVTP